MLAVVAFALIAASAQAQSPAPNDGLDATLWTQTSVEYRANAIGMYKLAQTMLDRALDDKSWTAAPAEQTGAYQNKPPAVVLDLYETVLDNSPYHAWAVHNDQCYSSKTWVPFVRSEQSRAIPGSLEFIEYARGKGVRVFYLSNRAASQEAAMIRSLVASKS